MPSFSEICFFISEFLFALHSVGNTCNHVVRRNHSASFLGIEAAAVEGMRSKQISRADESRYDKSRIF